MYSWIPQSRPASECSRVRLSQAVGQKQPAFVGWSNNHFNNLHFISSLGTNEQTNKTCFKHTMTSCCEMVNRRLLK